MKISSILLKGCFCIIFCLILVSAQTTTFTPIAGYEPGSDVTQHSRIDLDQNQIVERLGQNPSWYYGANQTYRIGGNSCKSSCTINRTIYDFSVNDCKLKGEKNFNVANNYWSEKGLSKISDCDFANVMVSAGLDASPMGSLELSMSSKSDAYRKDFIKKSTVYQNIFFYTIYEMQDAINDCYNGLAQTDNYDSVHAWDEAVAFYTGSLEGTQTGGECGLDSCTDTGDLLFNLAEKRCQNYGTCTGNGGSGREGYAQVNANIFAKFNEGHILLDRAFANQEDNDCSEMYQVKDYIVSQMIVPMMQGTFRYLWKSDPAVTATTINYDDKDSGELAAFALNVLPFVNDCNPTVGDKLYDRVVKEQYNTNFAQMKDYLESTYSCLGITCADVGQLCDTSVADVSTCQPYASPYSTAQCTDAVSDNGSGSNNNNDNEVPGWGIALIVIFLALAMLGFTGFAYYFTKSRKYEDLMDESQLTSVGVRPVPTEEGL